MAVNTHPTQKAKYGQPVALVVEVMKPGGVPEDRLPTASAAYYLSEVHGGSVILTKTSPSAISFSGNKATVEFNTSELFQSRPTANKTFFGELWINIEGEDLPVVQGHWSIHTSLKP